MKTLLFILILLTSFATNAGSAIFFHPDGMGVNTWQALRLLETKGKLQWDRLSNMAVYVGTMKDSPVATSHGGATTHAYGIKANTNSYGLINNKPIISASKFSGSIVHEAMKMGKKVALINSGSITEPGTGAFVARVKERSNQQEITSQVVLSGADIILSGGEGYFLPENTKGVFGAGLRKDGRNLVQEAKKLGYSVVYNAKELEKAVKAKPKKLLGIFAYNHTFNDLSEDELKAKKLPVYNPSAPTISQMIQASLKLFGKDEFLIIAEEEGTDNFSNVGNFASTIKAAKRADDAIGDMLNYKEKTGVNFTLITTSDSDAGGIQVSYEEGFQKIASVGIKDYSGGILVKSNFPLPSSVIDNTEIFWLLRRALVQ